MKLKETRSATNNSVTSQFVFLPKSCTRYQTFNYLIVLRQKCRLAHHFFYLFYFFLSFLKVVPEKKSLVQKQKLRQRNLEKVAQKAKKMMINKDRCTKV